MLQTWSYGYELMAKLNMKQCQICLGHTGSEQIPYMGLSECGPTLVVGLFTFPFHTYQKGGYPQKMADPCVAGSSPHAKQKKRAKTANNMKAVKPPLVPSGFCASVSALPGANELGLAHLAGGLYRRICTLDGLVNF